MKKVLGFRVSPTTAFVNGREQALFLNHASAPIITHITMIPTIITMITMISIISNIFTTIITIIASIIAIKLPTVKHLGS